MHNKQRTKQYLLPIASSSVHEFTFPLYIIPAIKNLLKIYYKRSVQSECIFRQYNYSHVLYNDAAREVYSSNSLSTQLVSGIIWLSNCYAKSINFI